MLCRERSAAEERLEKRRRAEALPDSTRLTVRLQALTWTLRLPGPEAAPLLEATIAHVVFIRTINRDRTGALMLFLYPVLSL